LDNEFEYVGNPLSMVGFRVAVTRFLKAERCRLKNRYLKGIDTPPLHINKLSWDRLKAYWNTDRQKEKAQKMSVARQSVRNLSCVGRRGKGVRLTSAVSVHYPSSVTCSSRHSARMCRAMNMQPLNSLCPLPEYYLHLIVTLRLIMLCECCVVWKWMSHVRVMCMYAVNMFSERMSDFKMTGASPQKKRYNSSNITRK